MTFNGRHLNHHLYADATDIYISVSTPDEIFYWMTDSKLKLNQKQHEQIMNAFPLPLLNQHVIPTLKFFDDNFNFREQIFRTFYYRIRDLWNVCLCLPLSVAETITTALAISTRILD